MDRYIEEFFNKFNQERQTRNLELKKARFNCFLELLSNPHLSYPTIHVGGTSGKGSTATFVCSILTSAEFKTGLTISPHVEKITERIQINNQLLPKESWVSYINKIRPITRRVEQEVSPLSYFEAIIGLAFYIFQQEKVDLAVVEVGIGGAEDVTNVVRPLVSIITNVDLDHTEVLGETIEEIAWEKSGIIKPNTPVISAAKQESIRGILLNQARKNKADITFVDERKIKINKLNSFQSSFNFQTNHQVYKNLKTSLLGYHQLVNASLAVMAIEKIQEKGFKITEQSVREGLKNAKLPGRLEVVKRNPVVILDGAHNTAKLKALFASTKKLFSDKNLKVIFIPKNLENLGEILKEFAPHSEKIYLTQLKDTPIPTLLSQTQKMIKEKYNKEAVITKDSYEAVSIAAKEQKENDYLVITGSFYLIGEVRSRFLS